MHNNSKYTNKEQQQLDKFLDTLGNDELREFSHIDDLESFFRTPEEKQV